MSTITGVKCDFCGVIFVENDVEFTETITIPGLKIGKNTYRLNNGHICKEACLPLLVQGLGDTKEVPLAEEPLPVYVKEIQE